MILLSTVAQASPDCLSMLDSKLVELKIQQNELLNEIVEAKASYRGMSGKERENRTALAAGFGAVFGGAAGAVGGGFIGRAHQNIYAGTMIGGVSGALIGGIAGAIGMSLRDHSIQLNDEYIDVNIVKPQTLALENIRHEEQFLISLKGNPEKLNSLDLSKEEWQTFINEGLNTGDFCSGGSPISSEEFGTKRYELFENKKAIAKELEIRTREEKRIEQAARDIPIAI